MTAPSTSNAEAERSLASGPGAWGGMQWFEPNGFVRHVASSAPQETTCPGSIPMIGRPPSA